jgi:CRP-like cAMP-binding protein
MDSKTMPTGLIPLDTTHAPMMAPTERAMRNLALQIGLDGSLTASEHRILAYLLSIVTPGLYLEIGHKDLSERLRMSRPQVSRAMRRLEDKCYIIKQANKLYKLPERFKTEGLVAAGFKQSS